MPLTAADPHSEARPGCSTTSRVAGAGHVVFHGKRREENMRTFMLLLALALAFIFSGATPTSGAEEPPAWAYPVNPPDFKPRPEDGISRRVPGSSATYSVTQLRDRFIAPVWHPGDHPPLPQIVAQGRKPNVFACGLCHRADGPGGPENSSLAGLPATYFVQQMADYKSGARKTSAPKRNVDLMIGLAKAATDEEIAAAAAYFSALKPRQHTRVVETDSAPKTFIMANHYASLPSGEKQAIGQRIVEMPEVLEQFVHRDTHARFIAYAPV